MQVRLISPDHLLSYFHHEFDDLTGLRSTKDGVVCNCINEHCVHGIDEYTKIEGADERNLNRVCETCGGEGWLYVDADSPLDDVFGDHPEDADVVKFKRELEENEL